MMYRFLFEKNNIKLYHGMQIYCYWEHPELVSIMPGWFSAGNTYVIQYDIDYFVVLDDGTEMTFGYDVTDCDTFNYFIPLDLLTDKELFTLKLSGQLPERLIL